MKSLSSVGLGLSVVFGCLFLALVAELYYLLWWKKRLTIKEIEDDHSSPAKELFYMFCWKRPSPSHAASDAQELCPSAGIAVTETLVSEAEAQIHMHPDKDLVFKHFGEDSLEAEFMRLQHLSGPPRFLFTIIEETNEDLESEDGKSRGDGKGSERSLSDLLLTVDTPYLTPLTSPSLFTPPLTPMNMNSSQQRGFNPTILKSASDAEFNRIRSSPPPKFKFLLEAEEKLRRKLREEAQKGLNNNGSSVPGKGAKAPISKFLKEGDDGPYITIVVDKNKDIELNHQTRFPQSHPVATQALAVAPSHHSSPAAIQINGKQSHLNNVTNRDKI